MEIAEFLLARFAEDKAVAKSAADGDAPDWQADKAGYEEFDWIVGPSRSPRSGVYRFVVTDEPQVGHIARWDPARVLAECEAKRRIVDSLAALAAHSGSPDGYCAEETGDAILAALALPYADHPEYREEWKP